MACPSARVGKSTITADGMSDEAGTSSVAFGSVSTRSSPTTASAPAPTAPPAHPVRPFPPPLYPVICNTSGRLEEALHFSDGVLDVSESDFFIRSFNVMFRAIRSCTTWQRVITAAHQLCGGTRRLSAALSSSSAIRKFSPENNKNCKATPRYCCYL